MWTLILATMTKMKKKKSQSAYFKLFNGKFKRVELLHLLAIPATSVPYNVYLVMMAKSIVFLKK